METKDQIEIIKCVKCGREINILNWETQEERERKMCALCAAINRLVRERKEPELNANYGLVLLCKERNKKGVILDWRFEE